MYSDPQRVHKNEHGSERFPIAQIPMKYSDRSLVVTICIKLVDNNVHKVGTSYSTFWIPSVHQELNSEF